METFCIRRKLQGFKFLCTLGKQKQETFCVSTDTGTAGPSVASGHCWTAGEPFAVQPSVFSLSTVLAFARASLPVLGSRDLKMPRDTVKLISAEGFEFIVDYEAACVSNTIKNMLSSQGSFTETELGEVRFPEITAPILEKVCQYFYYKLQFQNSTSASIPEFKVAPEVALQLLMASNFLDC